MGGGIYVFDMVKPVEILDLSKKMIKYTLDVDVKIDFIGLRPDENQIIRSTVKKSWIAGG